MIVVIGAGPAGLAVAWRLTERGHEVVVVEASPHVGGMSGSRTVSGIPVDLGSHRLDPAMPGEVRAAVSELVELQERPRRDRVRLDGSWLPFPLRPIGTVRGLGPATSLRLAADVARSRMRAPSADSYAEVVRAAHGPTAWDRFHEPYAWKLWDTDPEVLAGELARRRLPVDALDVVRGMFGRLAGPDTYLYPTEGFGALCEAMAERAGDVRTGTKVTGLIEHEERVTVGLADGRILSADRVFSTLPAGRVAVWLGLAEARQVATPTRAMVLVYLTVRGRPYTAHDTHHLPERPVLPTRLSEPTNHRDRPDDPDDRTVLCAEIPCWVDDPTWRAGADQLAQRVVDDLVRCELPDPHVLDVHVERLPSVYPVMTRSSLMASARAEEALASSRRVVVLGRQGLFTPDHTHHALQMGFAAANAVTADGGFDDGAWRTARRSFRDFVVES